ncbi:MAG: pyrroline-5-carboxylate reductase [Sphingomonadales bacterium]
MNELANFTAASPLLLVGCGNMGGAMLRGWLDRGLKPDGVVVVEANRQAVEVRRFGRSGIAVIADIGAIPEGVTPRAVVFAVKPQVIADVAPAFKDLALPGAVFLSIVAGKRIACFEGHLGAQAPVVRAMPNTPAAVGRAISVACANGAAGRRDVDLCSALLAAIGEVAWIEDEDWLDAVTAVSGSGPAYAFYLAECMARAGETAGLPATLAAQLARAAVGGAGELLYQSDDAADALRKKVTSPGGTTQAALEVMMRDDALQGVVTEAIAAATKRSRELSGQGA